MKIAVDVMGTDFGPGEIVLGALQAVEEYDCEVVLVGDSAQIDKILASNNAQNNPKVMVQHGDVGNEQKHILWKGVNWNEYI